MSRTDPSYTRKWSICKSFTTNASCSRGTSCKFNHSLIDTSRIVSLVGDVSNLIPSSSSSSATSSAQAPEQTLFLVEYTKYSAQPDSSSSFVDPNATKWRMRLCAGGRAELNAGLESVSVQPVYPVKGQGPEAGVALVALEEKVFGQCAVPDLARPSVCRMYAESTCTWGSSCKYSHTLFDTNRIEKLLEEAVTERGYREFRPILEIEYVSRQNTNGATTCMWRVTLRCVLGYHQKTAPQAVIVTSVDLTTAVRLMERQFAASSGKSQNSQTPNAQNNANQRSDPLPSTSRRANRPRRAPPQAMPNATASPDSTPPSGARQSRTRPHSSSTTTIPMATNPSAANPRASSPPPSYHDTMQGNYARTTSHDTKRRL